MNNTVAENNTVAVEISSNYPHEKLSGKKVIADLSQIVPSGGLENSQILIKHGNKSCFIRYANLEITDPIIRDKVNKAIKKSLNALKQPQTQSPPNVKCYRISQLSFRNN